MSEISKTPPAVNSGTTQLSTQEKAQQRQSAQERHQQQMRQLEEQHQAELQRLREHNQATINHIKERHESGVQELEHKKQQQLTYERKTLLEQKHRHQQELERQQQAYDQELDRQNRQFEKNYGLRNELNHQALINQRERMITALNNQKRQIQGRLGQHIERHEDPFYRMQNLDSRLKEDISHYTLELAVPEHEKDNVQVAVHPKRFVISGARSFQDRIEEPDTKLTTNSYQSFRQELPLRFPVETKLAETSYEDGFLKVRVPKIGALG